MPISFSKSFKSVLLIVVLLGASFNLFPKLFFKSKNPDEFLHKIKRSKDHGDEKWFCREVHKLGHDSSLQEEEYQVYSAFLEQYGFMGEQVFLIETVSRKCDQIEEVYKLENRFQDFPIVVKMISEKEVLTKYSENQKKGIVEGVVGVLKLSRVGFNRKRTRAVLNIDYYCGALCGEGGVRVLSKENNEWKLTNAGVYTEDGLISYTAYY